MLAGGRLSHHLPQPAWHKASELVDGRSYPQKYPLMALALRMSVQGSPTGAA